MSALNDCQFASLEAQGYTTGSLNDRLYAWLADQTGLTDVSLNDQWVALLEGMGYDGSLNGMQIASWVDMGAPVPTSWNDAAVWFWCVGGGSYGPTVIIDPSDAKPFCNYPAAGNCTASANYTANDINFTNPANTWLWTIEPPVPGVVLTNATLKTCTVETQNLAADTSFNLKVVATDSVSTDTANRTTTYTHYHRETLSVSVAESVAGSCTYDSGQGESSCVSQATYDATITGTPTSIVWALSGVTGGTAQIISGQGTAQCVVQTTGGAPNVSYTITCSVTSQFQNDSDAGLSPYTQTKTDQPTVAPVFSGTVPEQNWQINQAITPLDISTYFTGSDPKTYTVATGALPTGVTLDANTGVISGTPTSESTGSVSVTATNAAGSDTTNAFTWNVISVVLPAFHAFYPDSDGVFTNVLLGVGDATEGNTSTRYYPDFEGIYREFGSGEVGVQGLRVVRNELLNSNDMTQTGWSAVSGATIDDADTATLSTTTYTGIRQLYSPPSTDEEYTLSVELQWVSGDTDLAIALDLSFAIITVTSSWQRFSITGSFSGLTNRPVYAVQNRAVSPNETVVNIRNFQLEKVTAQSNQNPSEYVPTTSAPAYKIFDYENGNTVSSNVVTEAKGDTSLQYERRVVRNLALYSEQFDNAYWTKARCTVSGGVTDPNGGTTAFTMTATSADGVLQRDVAGSGTQHLVNSIWIRRRTGTGNIEMSPPDGGPPIDITAGVDSTWRRFTVDKEVSSTRRINVRVATSGDEIDVAFAQQENVSGQSNQNPGEYVPTTDAAASASYNTENGNTVTNNVVTEATGAQLPEAIYGAVAQPALTNSCLYSRDLTNWTDGLTAVVSYNQTGLTGEPNTASLAEDNDAGATLVAYIDTTTAASAATHTSVVRIKKDSNNTIFPAIYHQQRNATSANSLVMLNTSTGAISELISTGTTSVEVIDDGDWWKVLISVDNIDNTTLRLWLYPAYSDDWGVVGVVHTAQRSIIVGNCEVYLNKTIAEVRGASPIFTTSSSATVNASDISFDIANHEESRSAWYQEFVYMGDSFEDGPMISVGGGGLDGMCYTSSSSNRIFVRDGTNLSSMFQGGDTIQDTLAKLGLVYFDTDAKSELTVDILTGSPVEGAFDGAMNYGGPTKYVFTGCTNTMLIRDIRRYDITSYAEGKDIIDELMASDVEFSVQDSDGNPFTAPQAILNSSGGSSDVPQAVLDSDGNSFEVI